MPHKPRHKRRPQRDFRRPEYAEKPPAAPVAAPVISATVSATRSALEPLPVAHRPFVPAAPAVDVSHMKHELKRIAVLAGAMFVILIILSFFLR